jgi:hypothetical protein
VVSTDQCDWVDKVSILEFALNSATSSTTGYTPFELTYVFVPHIGNEITALIGNASKGMREFTEAAKHNLAVAHDAIIESCVHQMRHANTRRREETPFSEGDLIYLSTENLNLPEGRARKLTPWFIGLYKVIQSIPECSVYELELPEELTQCRIHPMFHVS